MREDEWRVAVMGGGPAGLMAAEVAAQGGARVTIYDRMPTVGRKFLLAGRGGLNITHSEPLDRFLPRYGAAEADLAPFVRAWTPDRLREWCAGLGQSTVIGSSGRVFPHQFKTSPLLRAWRRRLEGLGVDVRPRHKWLGFDGARSIVEGPAGPVLVSADATVLAMGGASWPALGSDGRWTEALRAHGVAIASLVPANCGFTCAWSDVFRSRFEGQPLLGAAASFAGQHSRGGLMVTRRGLEGGAVYALSAAIREAIATDGRAIVTIDLKPDVDSEQVAARLNGMRSKDSLSTMLRRTLGLSPLAIAIVREAADVARLSLATMDAEQMGRFVKAVPVRLDAPMPIARAISTAGGIRFQSLDERLMLRDRPGTFVAGEMMDWEAPTGGYLLQACFATGVAAGEGALAWRARASAHI